MFLNKYLRILHFSSFSCSSLELLNIHFIPFYSYFFSLFFILYFFFLHLENHFAYNLLYNLLSVSNLQYKKESDSVSRLNPILFRLITCCYIWAQSSCHFHRRHRLDPYMSWTRHHCIEKPSPPKNLFFTPGTVSTFN